MNSVSIDDREPVQHPSWCDPDRCTARPDGHGAHVTPARTIGALTLFGGQHHVSDAPPRRWVTFELRACDCCEQCDPTDVIAIAYEDARALYGSLGTILAEIRPDSAP